MVLLIQRIQLIESDLRRSGSAIASTRELLFYSSLLMSEVRLVHLYTSEQLRSSPFAQHSPSEVLSFISSGDSSIFYALRSELTETPHDDLVAVLTYIKEMLRCPHERVKLGCVFVPGMVLALMLDCWFNLARFHVRFVGSLREARLAIREGLLLSNTFQSSFGYNFHF